jgi:hypothetical protein
MFRPRLSPCCVLPPTCLLRSRLLRLASLLPPVYFSCLPPSHLMPTSNRLLHLFCLPSTFLLSSFLLLPHAVCLVPPALLPAVRSLLSIISCLLLHAHSLCLARLSLPFCRSFFPSKAPPPPPPSHPNPYNHNPSFLILFVPPRSPSCIPTSLSP